MVLPPNLSRKYAAVADRYSQTASKAEQIALCQFIRDGHLTSQTKKLKKLYAQKLKKLKNEVRNTFGSDCTIQTGAAGTSLALTVPYARTGLETKKRNPHEGLRSADSRGRRRHDHAPAFLFLDPRRRFCPGMPAPERTS